MEKKAIAYTTNINVGNTGLVIECALERKRIEEYAKENGITIVAWFEEEANEDNPMARPKLNEALACTEPHELVLVERAWAISRKWREIRGVMEQLKAKNVHLECATRLWDCISIMARHYYRARGRAVCPLESSRVRSINLVETYGREARWVSATRSRKIRKPAHLAFAEAM